MKQIVQRAWRLPATRERSYVPLRGSGGKFASSPDVN
jgi:hypothetical protein